MKLIILGDVHGDWINANATVNSALKAHPDTKAVIQLGDLGDGWPTPKGLDHWNPDFDLPIYVVDGNHENFDAIATGNTNPKLHWAGRGAVIDFNNKSSMFMGGATSPDMGSRTIGIDWWPQESITRQQVEYALDWNDSKIEIMFCHERADIFPIPSYWKLPMFEGSPGASDRAALSLIYNKWKPRWYFHGHWHFHDANIIDGTKVIACPLIDSRRLWTVFDTDKEVLYTNWTGEEICKYSQEQKGSDQTQ